MSEVQPPPRPPFDDELVEKLLHAHESLTLEFKRVGGDGGRKLQTVVAFANTEGGLLVLGIEDEDAACGKARVTGIQSNPEAIDELRRHVVSRVTPPLTAPDFAPPRFTEIGCTLRDGSLGSVVLVHVEKSVAVHSIVDGGTHVRAGRTNRQLSAAEIIELSMQRGVQSWVNGPADVSLAMLEVPAWREYAEARRLTRPMANPPMKTGCQVARQVPRLGDPLEPLPSLTSRLFGVRLLPQESLRRAGSHTD